jgi:lauroyl/myristoyl acyltransferase
MFNRKEGFEKAIRLLRDGGAVGILSDQHSGDSGVWVPFFGPHCWRSVPARPW